MPRRWTSLALLFILVAIGKVSADGPTSKRIVEGRVSDAEGKTVGQGKVMFAPEAPGVGLMLSEAATATINAEGRYRIELTDFPPYGPKPLLASGPLKYLVLSPGFKQSIGTVEAGTGPSQVDIKLEAQPWKTTDLVIVDRDGKPAADVEVTVNTLQPLWAKLRTDAEGHCRIEMAPDQPFGAWVRREGYPALRFSLRGASTDPSGFKLTLREPIRGRVVDGEGKPLAGVSVGGLIGPESPQVKADGSLVYPPGLNLKMRPFAGLDKVAITDVDGRFALLPTLSVSLANVNASGEFRTPPLRLTLADSALKHLAYLDVDTNLSTPLADLILRPTRPVSISIEHGAGPTNDATRVGWGLYPLATSGRPLPIINASQEAKRSGEGDRVELNCPPGKYRFQATLHDLSTSRSHHLGTAEMELTVPEGEGPFEAPPIRLVDSAQQQLAGKLAPEIEATDLDTGKPVTLGDFRGKVVVLDFWGYWCGPCVTTMPQLAEVQRHFDGKPVIILSLHDASVQSREEYDRQIKGVKKALWGDQDIPLKIILDRPGTGFDKQRGPDSDGISFRRYQIRGVPTLFLIDQAGKVEGLVHFRDHDGLKTRIQRLLDKPPAN